MGEWFKKRLNSANIIERSKHDWCYYKTFRFICYDPQLPEYIFLLPYKLLRKGELSFQRHFTFKCYKRVYSRFGEHLYTDKKEIEAKQFINLDLEYRPQEPDYDNPTEREPLAELLDD